MRRRDFIKIFLLASACISARPFLSFASYVPSWVRDLKEIELTYKLQYPERDKALRLWVPLPMNTSYQKLLGIKVSGSAQGYQILEEPVYHTPIFYAEFPKGVEKTLELRMHVLFWERDIIDFNKLKPNNTALPEDLKLFLRETPHITISGKVKEIALKITKGKKTDLDKLRAIYDWVCENTYRDPSVKGCGEGVVWKAFEEGKFGGKCTDISSIFVALCRASGLPAREIFGLRVLPSKLSRGISNVQGDATKAQHCKAEVWINTWIPVDPADVRKFMLEEKISDLRDQRVQKVKDFLFGGWDNHWVQFNYARDFMLEPPPASKETINEFMYPQAEVDGKLMDKHELTFEYSKYLVKPIKI